MLGLVGAGLSGWAIAKRLGKSHPAVYRMLCRLAADGLVTRTGRAGTTRWHLTKKWNGMDGPPEELREWVARGDSLREIAARLGVNHITVGDWVREGKAS